jgi:SAM-dependent methyltransferase
MCPDLTEIARHLCCPDDGAPLVPDARTLRCSRCSRTFRFQEPNLLEILPSKAADISLSEVPPGYGHAYLQAYSQVWEADGDAKPWGANETLPPKTVRMRQRHALETLQLLHADSGDASLTLANRVFCDVSAGAGNTTFLAAQRYRLVFHCDLSASAVRYASVNAARMGLENVVILRADYLRSPLCNSVHNLTCIDSLIRGPWHDVRLLTSIRKALAPGGSAVVDFHNWWHNPLRRLGLLRQNFGENRSYTRKEVLQLLAEANIDDFTIANFTQEADSRYFPGTIASRLIPATRFMVRLTSNHRSAL